MAMYAPNLDAIFSALADPTRRAMVERLARGAASISELSQGFPLSQPAISKHVKILEHSGLLQRDISGRTHICRVNPEAVSAASAWCEQQRAFWNAAFDRLDAYLREDVREDVPSAKRQVNGKKKK